MLNEPERPIEKLLCAAAKKRRDEAGAPLELHPATRRLLQGEAARKFARAERVSRSFFQGLGQLWPRFAWGVGTLAVLAVTVWLLVPMPGKNEPHALLAKNRPILAPSPPKEALAAPPAAQPAAPAPPAPAAEANPSTVAFADALPAARRKLAPESAVQFQPLAKDSLASEPGGEAREKLALAAASQLASRDQVAEAQVAASSPMPAPAPAATVTGGSAQRFGSAGQLGSTAAAPVAPGAPSPITTAPAVAGVLAADESAKLAGDRAAQLSLAYKSLPAAAPDNAPKPLTVLMDSRPASAAAIREEPRSISATQWFAQIPQNPMTESSLDGKAAPAHPVLAAFQVEQTGRELRIVDGDGSVYSGYLRIANAARRQPSVTTEAPAATRSSRSLGIALEGKPAARLDAGQPMPQTYSFRVAGTNRSLHQKVVFTGNLLATTNLALFQAATNAFKPGESLVGFRGVAGQPGILPLLHSQISGKVVIGNGKAVEINALPTSP
ncbi:MAG: hypothetical protein ACLQU3_05630 [Limisphaerales bacterium]